MKIALLSAHHDDRESHNIQRQVKLIETGVTSINEQLKLNLTLISCHFHW